MKRLRLQHSRHLPACCSNIKMDRPSIRLWSASTSLQRIEGRSWAAKVIQQSAWIDTVIMGACYSKRRHLQQPAPTIAVANDSHQLYLQQLTMTLITKRRIWTSNAVVWPKADHQSGLLRRLTGTLLIMSLILHDPIDHEPSVLSLFFFFLFFPYIPYM